jgi:hypothetical protein
MNKHVDVNQRLNQSRDSLKNELRRLLAPEVAAEANSIIDEMFENVLLVCNNPLAATKARLIKETTELWRRVMRDNGDRPVDVSDYLIEELGVESVLRAWHDDKRDLAQLTAGEVLKWLAGEVLTWEHSEPDEEDVYMQQVFEAFEAFQRGLPEAAPEGSEGYKPTVDPSPRIRWPGEGLGPK